MNLWAIVKISAKALVQNKFRALLTTLGIIIGVAAVIAMLALGRGAQEMVKKHISSMGTDVLWVRPGSRNSRGISGGAGSVNTLTVEDIEAIQRECPSVEGASPTASTMSQVVFGNQNWNVRVEGYNERFLRLRDWEVVQGQFFDDRDVRTAARVAVLGQTVVEELFPDSQPMGQTIRIGHLPFKVVGILEEKGAGMRGEDHDDTIVVPYTTVQKKFQGGVLYVQAGIVRALPDRAEYAEEELTELLRQRHNIQAGEDDDFMVKNLSEMAKVLEGTLSIMTSLLAGIAAISLLVGGIGIMNIMLVSVSERTREIGIHMSIGARPSHVRIQFLAESVVLCLLGGLIGLFLGMSSSLAFSEFLGWPFSVSVESVWVALLFPTAIGTFFGNYPAHKAARLDPIEALRYE
jgi:putative ABC transport system permease protein